MNNKNIITTVRALKRAESDRNEGFGVVGSAIGEGGREGSDLMKMDERRSRIVGLGTGARKAMEKSLMLLGVEGVTIIAGSGLFSSTRGRVRSRGAGMSV
jgi:hypothetical protein